MLIHTTQHTTKFKVNDVVEDIWYPQWGTGTITSVMNTRYKLKYPGAPDSMKNREGLVIYDLPHANHFLVKSINACDWATEGIRVKIIRKDIRPLDKRNKTKEGIIKRIDGGYIYVIPLYAKHEMELYINEILPGKGFEMVKKEYDEKFKKALKQLKNK